MSPPKLLNRWASDGVKGAKLISSYDNFPTRKNDMKSISAQTHISIVHLAHGPKNLVLTN
jgi:hypothetical protein